MGAKGSLLWATAQLLTVVKSAGSSTWIFSATVGIVPSMAFRLEGATIKDCKCNVGSNGVLSQMRIGTDYAASIRMPNGAEVNIVILSNADADLLWTPTENRAVLARGATLVTGSDEDLRIQPQPNAKAIELFVWPGKIGSGHTHCTVPVQDLSSRVRPPTITKIRQERVPTRDIPISPSGKAQEPSLREWEQYSAAYNVTLHIPPHLDFAASSNLTLHLAIDYEGDASRLMYSRSLLTDNWYSGYNPMTGVSSRFDVSF